MYRNRARLVQVDDQVRAQSSTLLSVKLGLTRMTVSASHRASTFYHWKESWSSSGKYLLRTSTKPRKMTGGWICSRGGRNEGRGAAPGSWPALRPQTLCLRTVAMARAQPQPFLILSNPPPIRGRFSSILVRLLVHQFRRQLQRGNSSSSSRRQAPSRSNPWLCRRPLPSSPSAHNYPGAIAGHHPGRRCVSAPECIQTPMVAPYEDTVSSVLLHCCYRKVGESASVQVAPEAAAADGPRVIPCTLDEQVWPGLCTRVALSHA
jgi:hypothetical protein